MGRARTPNSSVARAGTAFRAFHTSPNLFRAFDLGKASLSATHGPAIYLSEKPEPGWAQNFGGSIYVYEVAVQVSPEEVLGPGSATQTQLERISALVGRKVEAVPIISLERRFGSVREGLLLAGIRVWAHRLGARPYVHFAVYDPSVLTIIGVHRFESERK